jgi:hypothetical protein
MIYRSVHEKIREGLTRSEQWEAFDKGLIWCWELGRIWKNQQTERALKAQRGELPISDWKGGVEKKLKSPKQGSLQYLAQWQGMRGEDLCIDPTREITIICSKFEQAVVFTANLEDMEP